jgi:type IV fimbrial biogenesis protein FimT
LVELMITLVVFVVLASIAFPQFREVIQTNRVATQVNQLATGLALARSEAVRLAEGSGVCASSDGASCGTDWSAGWLVWDDADGDGELESGETVVRYAAPDAKVTLSGPTAGVVAFDSRGRRTTTSTVEFDLQPSDCTSGDSLLRTITVSATGTAKLSKGACE